MNGKERIKALLNGNDVDRIAASAWMHVPSVDRDPDAFSRAMINFADDNDWDLLKVQLNAFYITEAYGADIEFFEQPPLKFQKIKKLAEIKKYPIENLEDLKKLKKITVAESPVLQRDITSVKKIIDHYNGTKVVIPTLFSAYSWLSQMTAGREETVKEFIKQDKVAVANALTILNEVNKSVVDAYVEAGVDGFFFATSYTSPLIVSEEEFEEFNRAYDEPLLKYINEKTWFNMLHIHGNADLYIEKLVQYPVQSINWENESVGISPERLTSAAKLRSLTDKVLVGGTDQFHDFYGSEEVVEKRLKERLDTLLSEIPDKRFIFGAGCSLPLDIPADNIKLLRKVANSVQV
jgi:uroporphyrinogen decarboxylase